MSMKERLAQKSALIGKKPREQKADAAKPASTGPGQLFAFMGLQKDLQEENDRLKLRVIELESSSNSDSASVAAIHEQLANLQSGKSFMVKLDALSDAAGGRRDLSEQEFTDLRENLRLHPLIHPITVRRLSDDRLEIVSGHNRAAAYRELGRESIPATFIEADDVQAADATFFANLLQPKLPDFEKFLNLKRFQERHPDVSQAKIAESIGVDRRQISRLLSFEDLPPEAITLVRSNSRLLGSAAASDLAKLTKEGMAECVTAAIRQILDGAIDQSQAAKYAKQLQVKKPVEKAKQSTQQRVFRSGNKQVCELRYVGKTLRIDVKSQEHADMLKEQIAKVIEEFVTTLKV